MENILKGKKMNMSQIFLDTGVVVPVTLVKTINKVDLELENKPVSVTGTSKGKGFTGVMKKWGFHGSMATRGQAHKPRAAGSIGSQTPGRVLKGKKMAGRQGNKRVTVQGLKIVKVIPEENQLMISGPVPGARNSDLTIKIIE